MNKDKLERVAENAYLAYGSVTEMKDYQGLPMPEWKDLPEKIHQAWLAATAEVAYQVCGVSCHNA